MTKKFQVITWIKKLDEAKSVTLRHARLDQAPTVDDWDFRSTRPGNNETIHLPAPAAGAWYIRVTGERAFNRLSVRAGFIP